MEKVANSVRRCLESIKQVIFILGNREHTEGLGRIGEQTETIKSSPLPLQGQDLVDKVDKVTREKNSTKSVFLVRKIAP
jgi:hypothetical protein